MDTRLRKLDEGQFDSIVLASAGLRRLGWVERIAEYLPVEIMCPAPGQGALAIETRDDGGRGMQASLQLDNSATHAAVTAERAVLEVLGGGCQVPVGAYASLDSGELHLRAIVIRTDGSTLVKREIRGASTEAHALGAALGRELLEGGADEILAAVYGSDK